MISTNYYHGCLGVCEAERRLRDSGEDGAFLLRESDVKQGMFVISSVNESTIAHFVLPKRDGKFLKQTYEEVSQIIEDVIQTCEGYIYPVPPSGSLERFTKTNSLDQWSTCYCCNFTNDDRKIVDIHQRTHKLCKCDECGRYFKKSTYLKHKNFCNTTPDEWYHCHICDYKTVHSSGIRRHKLMHESRPFLCKEKTCRRCFKTEKELIQHRGFHSKNGFKCDECDKLFVRRYQKTMHMMRMHQRLNVVDQEKRGCLTLLNNGEIDIRVDEFPNMRAKPKIHENKQNYNYEKANISEPKVSSSRTFNWTCVKDVMKLSEETCFQDTTVVCQNGLVRTNKIILSCLFPPLHNIFSSLESHEEADTIIFPGAKSEDLRQLLEQFFEVNREATTIEHYSDVMEDFDIEELDPMDDELMLDLDEELKPELMNDDEQGIYDDEDEDKDEDNNETGVIDLEEEIEPGQGVISNGKGKVFELKITREMESNNSNKGRTMIQCPLCDFKTRLYSKERLRIHFKVRHSSSPRTRTVPCPICGIKNADIERHNSRFHTEVTCEICGELLENRVRYVAHRYKEHTKKIVIPEGMERCRRCQEFVRKEDFEDHSCQTQFPCEICGKMYYSEISLRSHKYKHKMEEKHGKTTYNCDQCGKQFENNSALNNHLKTHDPMNPCPQCGKLVRNLNDHIQVMHTADSAKKFQCKDCGKGFKAKPNLEKHKMNVHLKLRPHKCRYEGCEMRYNDTSNRDQHEKRSHGETFAKRKKELRL